MLILMLHALYFSGDTGKIIDKVSFPTNPIPAEKEHFIESLLNSVSKLLTWEPQRPLKMDLNSYVALIGLIKLGTGRKIWVFGVGDRNDNPEALINCMKSACALVKEEAIKSEVADQENFKRMIKGSEQQLKDLILSHIRFLPRIRSGGLLTIIFGIIISLAIFLSTSQLVFKHEISLPRSFGSSGWMLLGNIVALICYTALIGVITGLACARAKEAIISYLVALLISTLVNFSIAPHYYLELLISSALVMLPVGSLFTIISALFIDRRKLTVLEKYTAKYLSMEVFKPINP